MRAYHGVEWGAIHLKQLCIFMRTICLKQYFIALLKDAQMINVNEPTRAALMKVNEPELEISLWTAIYILLDILSIEN